MCSAVAETWLASLATSEGVGDRAGCFSEATPGDPLCAAVVGGLEEVRGAGPLAGVVAVQFRGLLAFVFDFVDLVLLPFQLLAVL